MPVTLKYPSKCELCNQAIPAGTEVTWIGGESGSGFSHVHITCPDPAQKKIRERRSRQEIDHDGLFEVFRCSREPVPYDPSVRWVRKHTVSCGQVTAVRRGDRVPSVCPYCDARWAEWEAA